MKIGTRRPCGAYRPGTALLATLPFGPGHRGSASGADGLGRVVEPGRPASGEEKKQDGIRRRTARRAAEAGRRAGGTMIGTAIGTVHRARQRAEHGGEQAQAQRQDVGAGSGKAALLRASAGSARPAREPCNKSALSAIVET